MESLGPVMLSSPRFVILLAWLVPALALPALALFLVWNRNWKRLLPPEERFARDADQVVLKVRWTSWWVNPPLTAPAVTLHHGCSFSPRSSMPTSCSMRRARVSAFLAVWTRHKTA